MKKLIVFVLTTMLLSSCLTVGRIQRNCDKFEQICVAEKETVTVYRDTTIYLTDTVLVQLPRDTVKLTDTITVSNGVASLDPVHREFGLIGVDAWVRSSVLNVDAYLTDSTMLYIEPDTVKLPGAVKTETITKVVPERYIPGFYQFTFWLFIIQLAVVVLWIGRNFLIKK